MKQTLTTALLLSAHFAAAQAPPVLIPAGPYDFSGLPEKNPRYFSMESRLTSFSPDGDLLGTDTYSLLLMYDPDIPGGEGYRCSRFQVTFGDTVTKEIPALKNWTHVLGPAGIDSLGRVFGIDHALFDTITDSDGAVLPVDKRYHVYNAFIDFHAMCSVFPRPCEEGGGIQDLKRIGDCTEHGASYSRPPTNLGSSIREGSFFENGRILLVFKGVSLVSAVPCALIGYDSGESRFKMILEPFPGVEVTGEGRSRYRGDIYRSLLDNWVQKVDLQETVISGTVVPMARETIYSVAERTIVIRNIGKEAYVGEQAPIPVVPHR
ncbi:hypothetical protein JXO52_10245 [bacterium]|nr:hypothetical protein [bacterium]